MRDGYLEALLAPDLDRARAVLEEAIAEGVPVRRLYLEVLQPALYEIGRLWSQAGSASRRSTWPRDHAGGDRAAGGALRLTGDEGAGRRASSRAADELHAPRRGWSSTSSRPTAGARVLGQRRPEELAALAARMPSTRRAVRRAARPPAGGRAGVRALRQLDPPPLVVVGGQAYAAAATARSPGADAYAPDAERGRGAARALPGAPRSASGWGLHLGEHAISPRARP